MGLLSKHELTQIERDITRSEAVLGQTMAGEWAKVSIALHSFIWAFVDSLRIPQLLNAAERLLSRRVR